MKVFNALQLKNGAKAKTGEYSSASSSLTQPVQFLPARQKTDNWAAWNLDWLEIQGMNFLRGNSRKLLKNYKLAKGIIDKSDYIVEEDNEYADIVDMLANRDEDAALELKFYPIIPNVINVLTAEFAKRSTKLTYRAVDEHSYNELMEEKRKMVEETLMSDAEEKIIAAIYDVFEDVMGKVLKK